MTQHRAPTPADVVACLATDYGLAASDCTLVSVSQNHVFRALTPEGEFYVRVTSHERRTSNQIEEELRFTWRAAAAGVRTARSLPSLIGNHVPALSPDLPFHVVVFAADPGRPLESSDLNDSLFKAMGTLNAQLHQVGTGMASGQHRHRWWQSPLITSDLESAVPQDQPLVRVRASEIIRELRDRWHDTELLLIHADIHFQNLLLNNGALAIIDFDNCEYGNEWLDFATVLNDCAYNRLRAGTPDPFSVDGASLFAASMWRLLSEGYAQVRALPSPDNEVLDLCLRLREIVRYGHYHRLHDVNSMSPAFLAGLKEMQDRIERRVPPLRAGIVVPS